MNYILLHNAERNHTTCSKTDRLQITVPNPDAQSLRKLVPTDASKLKKYLLSSDKEDMGKKKKL
jgi:hypothetical protein